MTSICAYGGISPMPDNDALCPQVRLNDSVVCQQVTRFLQETESDARTRGLAVAAWSALRFRRPTATLAQEVSAGALRLAVFNDPRLLAMPGGEPVIVDGLAIGGVGISGLPPELDAGLAARFVQRLT